MKPCPFCGSKGKIYIKADGKTFHNYCGDYVSVKCKQCGAEGPKFKSIEYREEGSEKKAIIKAKKGWNKRKGGDD